MSKWCAPGLAMPVEDVRMQSRSAAARVVPDDVFTNKRPKKEATRIIKIKSTKKVSPWKIQLQKHSDVCHLE